MTGAARPLLALVRRLPAAVLLAAMLLSTAHAAVAYRASASALGQAKAPLLSGTCVSSGSSSAVSSLTLSTASGTCTGSSAAGQIVIAQVTTRGNPAITAPSGWTLIGTHTAANLTQAVYWRLASSATTGGTWTFSTSQRAIGAVASFSGVDTASPVEAFGGQSAANSATVNAPSQNQANAASLLVALFGVAHGNATLSVAAGMAQAYGVNNTSAGPNGAAIAMDVQSTSAIGATGSRNSTATLAADNIGQQLLLRPAVGGTLTLDVPGGTAAGDVMIATLAWRDSASALSAPAGWTLVNSATQPTSGTNGMRLATFMRVATAAEPADYTWTLSGGNFEYAVGGVTSFSGVDTAAPVNAQGARAAGDGSSYAIAAPTLLPSVDGTMLVAAFGYLSADTWTPPSGFTESVDVRSPGSTAAAGVMLEMAYRLQPAAASVNAAATANSGYAADYGAAQILALKPLAGGPDHYELALPGRSLACLPTTVTVTACATASAPCTSAYTAASGATASLSASGATLGAGTVTFDANGIATTTLSAPTATSGSVVTVTLAAESLAASGARQCCPNGTSCSASSSCATTVDTAGFVIAASAGAAAATVPAQIAGTESATYYLRAVKSGTTTQACEAALSGATTVSWAYQCNDPATCSSSNLMSINGGSATIVQRNDAAGVTGYTSVPMNFDANGNAPFSFTFFDAGRATLWVGKTVNGSPLAGASNAFVTRPASLALSNIRQTAAPGTANPGAASAAGAKFMAAGDSFSATVTALASSGAATPNFGRESAPEGVLLTRTLVLPAGGAAGTLSNATLPGASFVNGAATVTSLAFSEVGIITLTPSLADGDYLGAGAVAGTPSGNVGRFVPARLALSSGSVTHRSTRSCSPASSFTYLDEAFQLGFTLTAQNTAGATTQNYGGSFARLALATPSVFNLAGVAAGTRFATAGATPRLALGTSGGSWSNGVASGITLTAAALRGTGPDGPFDAAFGIAPVDGDGVSMSGLDLDADTTPGNDHGTVATVALRFGRLRLANAIGSADRPLPLPIVAQSWNGTAFDTNTLDSCTTLPAAAVNFGNLRRTLTSADTAVAGSPVALSAGSGRLVLAAPAGGRSGSVDVALSLGSTATDASCLQPWTPAAGDAATAGANLAYLRGAWCGSSWDKDPSARATFGLYRGSDAVIHQRENY